MDVAAAAHALAATDTMSFGNNSPAWLVMGMAVMAVLYLTVRPRKRDGLSGTPKFSLSQQKMLERDMQNVIVELSELTRQMSAQLETRATKLELLMRDADERIVTLEAATAAANARPVTLTLASVGGDAMPMPTSLSAPTPLATTPVRGLRLADDSTSADRWNDVYRHASEGKTAREIARSTGRPQGEIELILALRPKPRTVDATDVAAVG